ncbi:hypothetical protein BN844_0894 [Pseudomonas sp. SHC52]|nr:hypothetical protein BN844_0894 [Pseudomonas sp. SHC52]
MVILSPEGSSTRLRLKNSTGPGGVTPATNKVSCPAGAPCT